MVTTVGSENSSHKLIENCIYLEHDAIAAYDAVIERLDNPEYRAQVESFRQDHLSHLDQLRKFAADHGVAPPEQGDMKRMLTTGKVAFADLIGGDGAVLRAMSTNESDTVAAYENAVENPELPPEMLQMAERALDDERRHKDWMERTAQAA